MEWAFDTTDPTRVGDVRREVLSHLDRHAESGSQLRIAELAFDELVGNACRYAPGPVWVQVDWSDLRPVLHVRDTGPGFRLTEATSDGARGGLRLLSLTGCHRSRSPTCSRRSRRPSAVTSARSR